MNSTLTVKDEKWLNFFILIGQLLWRLEHKGRTLDFPATYSVKLIELEFSPCNYTTTGVLALGRSRTVHVLLNKEYPSVLQKALLFPYLSFRDFIVYLYDILFQPHTFLF